MPWPAREQDGRDAPLRQRLLAGLPRLPLAGAVGLGARERDDVRGGQRLDPAERGRSLVPHQLADEPPDQVEVERLDLPPEALPVLPVQAVEGRREVALAGLREPLLEGHVPGWRATLTTPSTRSAIIWYPSAPWSRGRRWESIGAGSISPSSASARSSGK